MIVSEPVFFYLCSLFTGGFFGSLLCILAGKLFNRKYYRFRLSLSLLLLSAAIAFMAIFLIKIESASYITDLVHQKYLWIALYFALGVLAAASLKIMLPVLVTVYIASTCALGFLLYKDFDMRPAVIPLSVGSDSVVIGKESFQAAREIGDAENLCAIDFVWYTMPDEFLFFLPRVWYKPCGISSVKDASLAQGGTVSLSDGTLVNHKAVEFKNEILSSESKGRLKLLMGFYEKALSSPCVTRTVIKREAVVPALYNINIQAAGKNHSLVLERIM